MDDAPSLFVLGSFVIACSAQVSRFPRPGESAFALSFVAEPGGKGFNLAVGAHRLGVPVHGLFAVGDDAFAGLAQAALPGAGLSPDMLHRLPGQTGAGIGFIDASGETSLAVFTGANALLDAEHVQGVADRLRRASIVLAQFEISDASILEGFRIARRVGARTILNPSPFRMPPPELLKETSIIVVNEIEAVALERGLLLDGAEAIFTEPTFTDARPTEPGSDHVAPTLARSLFACGLDMLVVTLGRRGARLQTREGLQAFHPAFPVDAVDTLGAGDAFTAGFAVGLLEARSLGECLRRASACGALATRRHGVLGALATRDELEAFLDGHEEASATDVLGP